MVNIECSDCCWLNWWYLGVTVTVIETVTETESLCGHEPGDRGAHLPAEVRF